MAQVMTIREAVTKAREDGLAISEYALRCWIKQGKIPIRRVGAGKQLLFYPALVAFVTCADGGGDNSTPPTAEYVRFRYGAGER